MMRRLFWILLMGVLVSLPTDASKSFLKSTELIVDDDGIFYRAGNLSINRVTSNFRLTVSGNFVQQGYLDIYGDDPTILFTGNNWSMQYGIPFNATDRTLGFVNRTSGSAVEGDSFFIGVTGNLGMGVKNPTEARDFDTANTYLDLGLYGRLEWPYQPEVGNSKDWAWIGMEPTGNAGNHALIISVQDEDTDEEFVLYQNGGERLRIYNKIVQTHGAVSSISDRRVKRDIEPIDNALDKVLRLQGVWFDRKTRESDPDYDAPGAQGRQLGFLAQDVKPIIPEAVHETDGYYSVAYGNLMALLVEAYKEQDQRLEKLLKELDALEKARGITE